MGGLANRQSLTYRKYPVYDEEQYGAQLMKPMRQMLALMPVAVLPSGVVVIRAAADVVVVVSVPGVGRYPDSGTSRGEGSLVSRGGQRGRHGYRRGRRMGCSTRENSVMPVETILRRIQDA